MLIVEATIADDMRDRITTDETATAVLVAVIAAVNEPSSVETVVIIGLGSVDMNASVPSCASQDTSKVLSICNNFLLASGPGEDSQHWADGRSDCKVERGVKRKCHKQWALRSSLLLIT